MQRRPELPRRLGPQTPQHRALSTFFGALGVNGVSTSAHDALLSTMRLQSNLRDEICTSFDSEQVLLLVEGNVREHRGMNSTRLWKAGIIFGNWAGAPSIETFRCIALSAAVFLTARGPDVRHMITRYPEVGLVFARAEIVRSQITDRVYGANRLRPEARVARLLLHLAVNTEPIYRKKETGGRTVVGIASGGIVQGPTQRDLADALALGLATVEKVLSRFRDDGILDAGQASRVNRRYWITDREQLETIAFW
ncbi:helix-turn-helix domain-containing protein [Streptomyces turgidiscabies]|uniref:helix-turn-helix domain-containing protein n=1 Tax=Streptomyces turgidiscabies TaxID=85558 RepID=UPI0038F612EC